MLVIAVTAKSDVKSMLSSKNFKPALTKQEDVVRDTLHISQRFADMM